MVVTPFPIVKDAKSLQKAKAPYPIEVTLLGIVISVKLLQFLKV